MASGYSSTAYQASRRGRGPGLVLAILVNVLVALLLLTASLRTDLVPMAATGLSVFNVSGSRAPPEAEKKLAPKPRSTAKATTPRAAPEPNSPKSTEMDASTPSPFKMLIVSKEVFGASDIGKMAKTTPPAADAGGAAASAGGAPSYGPGEGPGGSTLYAADWYRKPRHAELAYYLPPTVAKGSWAMIACQTIPDYRVENCRPLAESPRGSGLANALRKAAWQFRVLPPRIDGKPMLNTWVRIRFDFTEDAPDD
ncbi:hypothetical protein ACFO8O_14260 [Hephaestia sp. GCM10023244]|uniref:hypothetical protein n=1 Tax=unclassified Hephaestia TaxID=2631281 RepID=UPI002077726B|nr:hypothetical protein [Hephaestia sp. MAHUQ-44]MCM8732126.1 hypothetical protein [Hephaestia sp. MAHUQ-44]